ncbi:MAG: hypothetical protein R3D70_22780 [Rhizobiaceae bacterium]
MTFDHDFLRKRIIYIGHKPLFLVDQLLTLLDIVFPQEMFFNIVGAGSLCEDFRMGMQPPEKRDRVRGTVPKIVTMFDIGERGLRFGKIRAMPYRKRQRVRHSAQYLCDI